MKVGRSRTTSEPGSPASQEQQVSLLPGGYPARPINQPDPRPPSTPQINARSRDEIQ